MNSERKEVHSPEAAKVAWDRALGWFTAVPRVTSSTIRSAAPPPRPAAGGGGIGRASTSSSAAAMSPARSASFETWAQARKRGIWRDHHRVLGEVAALGVHEAGAGANRVAHDAVAGLREHDIGRADDVDVVEAERVEPGRRELAREEEAERAWRVSRSGARPGIPVPPNGARARPAALVDAEPAPRLVARDRRGRRATRPTRSRTGKADRSPANGSSSRRAAVE